MNDHFLDVREVCRRLSLSKPDVVLAAIRARELRAFNVSSPGRKRPTWRIRESDFEAFLESRSVRTSPAIQPRRRAKSDPKITRYF